MYIPTYIHASVYRPPCITLRYHSLWSCQVKLTALTSQDLLFYGFAHCYKSHNWVEKEINVIEDYHHVTWWRSRCRAWCFMLNNHPLLFLTNSISVRPGSLTTDQEEHGPQSLSGLSLITNSNNGCICDSQRGRKMIFHLDNMYTSLLKYSYKKKSWNCFWEFSLRTFRKECMWNLWMYFCVFLGSNALLTLR